MGVFGDPASPMAPYGYQGTMYGMTLPQLQSAPAEALMPWPSALVLNPNPGTSKKTSGAMHGMSLPSDMWPPPGCACSAPRQLEP